MKLLAKLSLLAFPNLATLWDQVQTWMQDQYATFMADPKTGVLKLIIIIVIIVTILTIFRMAGYLIEFLKNRNIEKNGVLLEILVKTTTSAKNTESLIRNIH